MMKIIFFLFAKKQTNKQKNIADLNETYFFGHFHYESNISLLLRIVSSGFLAKFLYDFKYILNIPK